LSNSKVIDQFVKQGAMAKIIVSLDDNLIKVVPLNKDRMTLGRRPYNDIVVDNLAVSGEHAALQVIGHDYFIEDLNSTNGTYINEQKIKRQILKNGDTIEIGKYAIRYVQDGANSSSAASNKANASINTDDEKPVEEKKPLFEQTKFAEAYVAIKILSGASTGKELPLVKIVTTIGKPGEAVIAITKRPKSYMVAHVEGATRPSVNGVSFGIDAVPLKNGDLFELAGTAMQFIQN
jgi:pSer/pThr/pTyr-binding forkhead associated (FHA) protein